MPGRPFRGWHAAPGETAPCSTLSAPFDCTAGIQWRPGARLLFTGRPAGGRIDIPAATSCPRRDACMEQAGWWSPYALLTSMARYDAGSLVTDAPAPSLSSAEGSFWLPAVGMGGEAALEHDGTVGHDRRRHAGDEGRDPGLVEVAGASDPGRLPRA